MTTQQTFLEWQETSQTFLSQREFMDDVTVDASDLDQLNLKWLVVVSTVLLG